MILVTAIPDLRPGGSGSGQCRARLRLLFPTVRTQTPTSDEPQVRTEGQTTRTLIAVITLSDGGARLSLLTPGVNQQTLTNTDK